VLEWSGEEIQETVIFTILLEVWAGGTKTGVLINLRGSKTAGKEGTLASGFLKILDIPRGWFVGRGEKTWHIFRLY